MFKFNSLSELVARFKDEETCIRYLEVIQWGGKPVSPFDPTSKVYKCSGNKYKCNNTGKYFNARYGTIFHRSSIPLQKWYMAIWIFMSHKKGISSVQLSKDISVTQKTAWLMLQKIRECFGEDNNSELDGVIEIDETFVGGKNKNRHKDKKVAKCHGRSYKDKTPVFGMLKRRGKVVAKVVENTKAKTLYKHIRKHIKEGSTVYSDEWNYGPDISKNYNHDFILHCYGIYGKGEVYTNGIEGFWSTIKRGIIGIYHQVSRKYLQRYVNEFVFRYNMRKVEPQEVFNHILTNSYYSNLKDLTYAS